MKTSNYLKLTALASLLAVSQLSQGYAQQAKGQIDVNTSDKSADVNVNTSQPKSVDVDVQHNTAATPATTADQESGKITTREEYNRTHHMGVAASNKASSLIGMEVRNTQHEKLGEIKDLVVDLPSGKIAYAVLGTGGFLGLGEKLIAIPPSAFTASATEEHTLVLNADKAKIEGAPSIPKTNWPDIHAQVWGAENSYWNSATPKSDTGNAEIRTDIHTKSDRDLHRNQTDLNADQNRQDLNNNNNPQENKGSHLQVQGGIGSDQDHDVNVTSRVRTDNDNKYGTNDSLGTLFTGTIIKMDPESRTMTVRSGKETKEFKLGDQSTISVDRMPNARPVDLKVGYHVRVMYRENTDGSLVVNSVTRAPGSFTK